MTTTTTRRLLVEGAAPPLDLTVEATAPTVTVPLDDAAPGELPSSRTITGTAAVWDVPGRASVGPCIFTAGSISVPDDLRRVKLLLDHDHSRPVGYAEAVSIDAHGMTATFHLPAGDVSDRALAYARDGLRDALSVGVEVTDYSHDRAGRVVVKAARLREVSLVALPAFEGATVSSVTASHHPTMEGSTMPEQNTAPESTPPTDVEASTSTSSTPPASTSSSSTPTTVEAASTPVAVAEAPPAVPGDRRPLDLRAMTELVGEHLRAHRPAGALTSVIEAALNDVTPANVTSPASGDYGPNRPQYVDDLWQAAEVSRPTLEAFGTRELRSLKVHGWVWETRPEVDVYSGNKAEIPSGPVVRVRQEATAQRFAGGWDVDRAFVDLPNDSDEIADIFTEATRDYGQKSEDYAAGILAAAATEVVSGALSVPAALALIGVQFAGVKGARIGYVTMGTDAWADFANMTSADAPWWLRNLGTLSLSETRGELAGLTFAVNTELPATQILAADTRAARFWEVDPPIRVQALDVAHGGIDLGVFGYVAGLATDPRAILNVDTAGRAAP